MNSILKHPIVKKLLLLVASFFIFLAVLNFVIMPWYVHSPEVIVPKIIGMNFEAATTTITNANLESVLADTTFDLRFPRGTIIIQKPVAGSKVKEGRRIHLVISGGEPIVQVPLLKGRSLRDAKFSLERVGLKLGSTYEVQSNAPRDVIVDQQFSSGTKLKKGSYVNISISLGSFEGTITVPNLIGKSFSEAESTLFDSLLTVGKINYQPSFSLLPNTIIDQYPSYGSKLNQGDKVDLFVTKKMDEVSEGVPE